MDMSTMLNDQLPPPLQPQYTQAQTPHPPYFNGPEIPQPQHFNRSLPPFNNQDFGNNSPDPTTNPTTHPMDFNSHSHDSSHLFAQNNPNIYFKNNVAHPFFHPPILPPNNPTQSPHESNSNPVRLFQPSHQRLEPSRTENMEYFDQHRPATSNSEDLPPLDFSIIDNFESQAFELERQRILASQNIPTVGSNPSVTITAPTVTESALSRPKKKTVRKSKNPTHTGDSDVAPKPPAKRSRKNKEANEENLLVQTPINQAAFINGFLPKSLLVAKDQLPAEIQSVEQLMEYSDIELNMLAKKYSKKRGSSAADEMFLLDLHDQIEKIITINCIVRQISRDMADEILGKSTPYRGINGYQIFQKSDEAREIVKENGGIRAPGTNQKVGDAWNALGEMGQEYYNNQAASSVRKKQLNKSSTSNSNQATSNSSDARSMPTEVTSTSNEVISTSNEVISNSTDGTSNTSLSTPASQIPTPVISGTEDRSNTTLTCRPAKSRPLNRIAPTVQGWLADLLPAANNIAQTYKVQIAIICVSSFLGNGCLQLVEATPRLRSWFELDKLTNPENHTVARMQSAITGSNVEDVAEMGPVVEPTEVQKARARLNQLIYKETKKKFTSWPWTSQKRLQAAGYSIKVLDGALTSMEILTRPSNKLLPAEAIDINESILENKIRVLKVNQIDTDA